MCKYQFLLEQWCLKINAISVVLQDCDFIHFYCCFFIVFEAIKYQIKILKICQMKIIIHNRSMIFNLLNGNYHSCAKKEREK